MVLPISILIAHIAERRIAADEEAAAVSALLLHDPISVVVLADYQGGMSLTRGRLVLFALHHDTLFRDASLARDRGHP